MHKRLKHLTLAVWFNPRLFLALFVFINGLLWCDLLFDTFHRIDAST